MKKAMVVRRISLYQAGGEGVTARISDLVKEWRLARTGMNQGNTFDIPLFVTIVARYNEDTFTIEVDRNIKIDSTTAESRVQLHSDPNQGTVYLYHDGLQFSCHGGIIDLS